MRACRATARTLIRIVLTLMLLARCGNAAAEWSPVGGEPKIYSAFADRQSVRTGAGLAQMWGLYDFLIADVTAEGQPHQSTVVLREYDCAEPRVRLLAYVDYAGRMGAGKVISSAKAGDGREPAKWEPVVSGSLDEAFRQVACAQ